MNQIPNTSIDWLRIILGAPIMLILVIGLTACIWTETLGKLVMELDIFKKKY